MVEAERKPKVLTMSMIAKKLGWKTYKVTRLLKAAGCVEDIGQGTKAGRGYHYVTTRARVREKFPELARLL